MFCGRTNCERGNDAHKFKVAFCNCQIIYIQSCKDVRMYIVYRGLWGQARAQHQSHLEGNITYFVVITLNNGNGSEAQEKEQEVWVRKYRPVKTALNTTYKPKWPTDYVFKSWIYHIFTTQRPMAVVTLSISCAWNAKLRSQQLLNSLSRLDLQ